jgi:hypothetical protein
VVSSRLPVRACGCCAVFPAPRRGVLHLYGSASFGKAAAALYSVLCDSFLSPVAMPEPRQRKSAEAAFSCCPLPQL